ncbi:hypothetical protein M885DRAFT_509598 [Pelagophyceae sp. CCMP2097]|nr:hypothetical protein M885DRAFT_509598 [Pelagophyceae sp. CCMP2097]
MAPLDSGRDSGRRSPTMSGALHRNSSTESLLGLEQQQGATLVLDNGTRVDGFSFGAKKKVWGEVVFNTGMVGYPEALTDPSYRGQILVLTYPLIGNYGVPSSDVEDAFGLPKYFESKEVHIAGLVVANYSEDHSHWASTRSLGAWLESVGVPGIWGVDTRRLTKMIREGGALLGRIDMRSPAGPPLPPGRDLDFEDPNLRNLVAEVSTKTIMVFGRGRKTRIVALDCGIKFNIIRYLVEVHEVELTVVPFDYDLEANVAGLDWDGVFVSNGPGDPSLCVDTIKSIKWAITRTGADLKPVFGICLGNQILALAAGGTTYKMKYGNRGMNQPCIDLRSTRCYITSQNHGYAVDDTTLPPDWKALFINANDNTNEGIIHVSKPFSSVQFHPEAAGGPMDTAYLFESFVRLVRGAAPQLTLLEPSIYRTRTIIKRVLLLGSGGLSIGQAGEFDYSGSQCIKGLKEERIEVILVNPNIATVQTSRDGAGAVCKEGSTVGGDVNTAKSHVADRVYLLPVTAETVVRILERETDIDGIILSMGGQTALNVGIELWRRGELQKRGIRVLGTQIDAIISTEDREIFSTKLKEIDETLALSMAATTVAQALQAAETIGYPVLVRAAFTLGGAGSGFADNAEELIVLAKVALEELKSPQILVDQDLRGWKEVEYEVVRDCRDNCITVCNMENFDPLGVHTGDSIVVAPSQTLTNREYFMLREAAIKVVRHIGVVGECNIQYALCPYSERYCIIEVNARLSRSSALASKATGYPLAYVATKLSLGHDLVSIRNSVTGTTTACFEPSLDYCVVKVPRWDLAKFPTVSTSLGSAMKSVGEVMAIGRSFEETLQKAVRMAHPNLDGLEGSFNNAKTVKEKDSVAYYHELDESMRVPHDQRLFAVQAAFEAGYTVDRVHELTRIDKWFLSKMRRIAQLKKVVAQGVSGTGPEALGEQALRTLKQAGFSDVQLGRYLKCPEARVRRARLSVGVRPVTKQIDTLAAEFPARTNYLYMTYHGDEDDVTPDDRAVIVLGCGAYSIGSSVEFDWSAVSCVRQCRASGYRAIVINYNPETVSTDYDVSDRLYFEELSLERVLDIYEREQAWGLIVSVGGQIPNNLAKPLHDRGVHILGTSPVDIERAEDRHKFSAMLDEIGVDQPPWRELQSIADATGFADEVGYPVLVRPSFVLSGAAMNVASCESELSKFLTMASDVSPDHPVVVSKFIKHAKEIEFDAVASDGIILNYAISEHVENAGVHSGDATLVLPAQKLYVQTQKQVKVIAAKIARALNITGPFNIQLMARENEVKVIECNLRASRSFPFLSKTLNANFISLATRVMLGVPAKPYVISMMDIDYVAVKAAMFSFTRLRGADPTLGVEMASTGEVACMGADVYAASLLALRSTGMRLPTLADAKAGKAVFLAGPLLCECARQLADMGFQILASPGTAMAIEAEGVKVTCVSEETSWAKAVVALIASDDIVFCINIPSASTDPNNPEMRPKDRKVADPDAVTNGYLVRRAAIDFGVGLITNDKCAVLFTEALQRSFAPQEGSGIPRHMDEYYAGAFQ